MPTAPALRLAHGDLTLDLVPEIGGGIARLTWWRGQDILRPAAADTLERRDPLGLACYPMVPFAGRITGGRFAFDGASISLAPNMAGEPAAIHGQGWRNPWRLESASSRRAMVCLDYPGGDWPWAYRAEQTFELSDDGLSVGLSVENRSPRAMPAGLGLHPFFPRLPGSRLWAPIGGVFKHPGEAHIAAPPAWEWSADPPVTTFVDHQFMGWTGEARVTWPSRSLQVSMVCDPPPRFLVVYAPEGGDGFCVEPVTHQLDAVNLSAGGVHHGMVVLAPGQSTALTMRLSVGAAT